MAKIKEFWNKYKKSIICVILASFMTISAFVFGYWSAPNGLVSRIVD